MDLYEEMAKSDAGRRILERLEEEARLRDGVARQTLWECEDGWVIGYTTTRVAGGPFHDHWVVMAYRPTGKGARTGKATEWRRTYARGFATRKTARRRAEALYYQHSPKAAQRHGVSSPGTSSLGELLP